MHVVSVAFSPDNSRIVSGSSGRTVRICNTELCGEGAREYVYDSVTSVAFRMAASCVCVSRASNLDVEHGQGPRGVDSG